MLKMRSSRKTDLKNWPNISNIQFELTIDFMKDNGRNEEVFSCCDGRPRDRIDNIFRKLISDDLDKYQTPYIGPILGL